MPRTAAKPLRGSFAARTLVPRGKTRVIKEYDAIERDGMKLNEYFPSTRKAVADSIVRELSRGEEGYAAFSGDSARIFSIMKDYALSGKMLRGIFVCLGAGLFAARSDASPDSSPGRKNDIFRLAAALELLQAGLLVHDDIMDRDDFRRGMPTMHKTFEGIEADSGAADASALGEAIGICAGDIYYFISWNIITSFGPEMGELFSRELRDVCLAQIKDVRLGAHKFFPPIDEALEVYTYKTARYTICLPLCAGAVAAGRSDARPALEELGMNLGILYQLQDDYLGLFGEEKELGKPVGSDIREGKKTPYMIFLLETLSEAEKRRFEAILGSQSIDSRDVEYVRGLVKAHHIDVKVRSMAESYAREAERCLALIPESLPGIDDEKLGILKEFIGYSLTRKY